MKIKSKTKKILVLTVMVALLVTTGVLNFVLSNKLNSATDAGNYDEGAVTQTFFAAARSDREATRESEFLYLDAIINSDSASSQAKKEAETQKMDLVKKMEQELELETQIKGRGYEDTIVTIGDGGVSVVVNMPEMTVDDSNKILALVVAAIGCSPKDVKVIPYV